MTYADRLASEAGDGPLRAMAMIARSALYSPVPHGGFGGDPATALAILDAAERVAGRGAPKLLLTWLYARRDCRQRRLNRCRSPRAAVDGW